MECSLCTHCMIYHSKAHSVDQCEYNFFNKTTAPVRQIYPKHTVHEDHNRSGHQSQEDNQPRYDDRYRLERRDDNGQENRRDDNW